MDNLKKMLEDFYPYAKERLGFEDNAKIVFLEDENNAANPLGKTAYYEPSRQTVSVFVTGRHPKDIMRSISHELVHHAQNCRGDLTPSSTKNLGEEGYAQKDEHLRELEREAYEVGNMNFRDWEDSVKHNATIYEDEDKKMSNKDLRNHRLNSRLMEKWGYKPKKKKKPMEEEAESKAQQRFMAAALNCQKNDYQDCGSEEVKQAALDMSKKDLEDYASTSTEDLPEKVTEQHGDLEGRLDFDLERDEEEDELAAYYDEFKFLRNGDDADDTPDELEDEFLAMLGAEEELEEGEGVKEEMEIEDPKIAMTPEVLDMITDKGATIELAGGAKATKQDDNKWKISGAAVDVQNGQTVSSRDILRNLDLPKSGIEEETVEEISSMASGSVVGAPAAEDEDSEIEDAFGDDGSPLLNMDEDKTRPFADLAAEERPKKHSVREALTNRNRLMAEQVMRAWFKK